MKEMEKEKKETGKEKEKGRRRGRIMRRRRRRRRRRRGGWTVSKRHDSSVIENDKNSPVAQTRRRCYLVRQMAPR